jgi:hypothetical protein
MARKSTDKPETAVSATDSSAPAARTRKSKPANLATAGGASTALESASLSTSIDARRPAFDVTAALTPGGTSEVSENERIARLAYHYWEVRGCQGGSPLDDWLRAEREVRNQSRR